MLKQEEMIMRTDLMLRGAALLEADAANPNGVKFNLATWAADSRVDFEIIFFDGEREYKFPENEPVAVNCGTQACAFGLFAISGAFKKEGLDYVLLDGLVTPKLTLAAGTIFLGWEAVYQLFDITEQESMHLFSSVAYNKQKGATAELEVAKRMREMVVDHLNKNAGVINQSDE